MTHFKRRFLIGTTLVVLVLLGVGVCFYFNFFASTSTALRYAEAGEAVAPSRKSGSRADGQ